MVAEVGATAGDAATATATEGASRLRVRHTIELTRPGDL